MRCTSWCDRRRSAKARRSGRAPPRWWLRSAVMLGSDTAVASRPVQQGGLSLGRRGDETKPAATRDDVYAFASGAVNPGHFDGRKQPR